MSQRKKPAKDKDRRLRAAAEKKVARAAAALRHPAGKAAEETLHELQVHQIELEMQNEELKRAQAALEESWDKYQDFYDGAPVGYFTLTPQGVITEVNRAGAALLGVERPGLVRRGLGRFVVAEDLGRWDQHLVSVWQSGEKQSCELELQREGGAAFHVRLESLRLDRPAGGGRAGDRSSTLHVAMSDISERKQAEQRERAYQRALRSLGVKLAVAEQEERRRIAAGLHDNVVQVLLLAMMRLAGLARESVAPGFAPALRDVRGLVNQAVRDVRRLLFDLSPVVLYELGFVPAVQSLLEKMQQEHGTDCGLQTDGRPTPMTDNVRVVLYRAVCEVLRNAAQHARATHVTVSIGRQEGGIQVEVRDDGIGFDPQMALSPKEDGAAFGLFDVRERLEYLGGSLTIESATGKGTAVVLRAPLAQRNE